MVVLSVETRNQVAGNRTHGAIYPMVSAVRVDAVGGDAEHIEPVHYRKITVEDGRFARASSRIGHTGAAYGPEHPRNGAHARRWCL